MGKIIKPRILKVEETYIGKLLQDPAERRRHDNVVNALRNAARPDIEAIRRSERLTSDDYRQMVY